MILAVALVLVGIPVALYFQDQWSQNLPLSWKEIGEDRMNNGTVQFIDGDTDVYQEVLEIENGSVIHMMDWTGRYQYFGGPPYFEPWYKTLSGRFGSSTTVLWDVDNVTDVSIIDQDLSSELYPDLYDYELGPSSLYWISRYNASSLISSDIWKVKYQIDAPGNYTVHLGIIKIDSQGVVDLDEIRELWSGSGDPNETGIISYDLLDVLGIQTALGDGKLTLWIEMDDEEILEVGDSIYFRIWILKSSGGLITQSTVTNITLVALTLVLGFVAIASTPYWNPTNSKDPGWIGRRLRWINSLVQRFLARRARRRSRR